MKYESIFGIEDVVYLKLRQEKVPGIICAVKFMGEAHLTCYGITWSNGAESYMELTSTYLKDEE